MREFRPKVKCDIANVHDSKFQYLIKPFLDTMIVLTDTGFHAREGDPANMKICPRGTWNVRMVVETVLSMLTTVCHFKKMLHRAWAYFQARLAYTMAAFNCCAMSIYLLAAPGLKRHSDCKDGVSNSAPHPTHVKVMAAIFDDLGSTRGSSVHRRQAKPRIMP